MSDYQGAPAYRERSRRRVRYRLSTWQQLVQVAIVAFGAVAMAAALILLLGVLMSLVGCTSLTASEQRDMEAQARGCYCKGVNCKAITSAAGQAAIQAASETSSRATQINQLTR